MPILTIPCDCEDGKVWTSRHGGNDPDVWAIECETCSGFGFHQIEDEDGLVSQLRTRLLHPSEFKRQWRAECLDHPTIYGTGSTERHAVADLIDWLRLERDDAEFEAERVGEMA